MTKETGETEEVVAGPPSNLVAGVIKALRPRQWVKNVLVLAAPVAGLGSGIRYDYGQMLTQVGLAFVVFSLAASSIYLVNDVRDVEADREHPTKRFRPIAAGVVPEWLAYALAVLLGAASLGIAWMVTPNLALVMAVYLGMQLAYCFDSNTKRCLTSASCHRRTCCAPSPAAWPPKSRCHNGFCSRRRSRRCSWWPASVTPNCNWPNAPAPRSASRWRATPART